MLRNVILFVLVADTVINFLQFAPPLILTQGGPLNSTNLLMHEVYRRGFLFGDPRVLERDDHGAAGHRPHRGRGGVRALPAGSMNA